MASKTLLLAAVAAQSATAHFSITYPPWRADSLNPANAEMYSQWDNPCAGVPFQAGNTTDWPLQGGSLAVDLHHPWTYLFVNLGLGPNATNFNVSLTPEFYNVTGNGTFCIDRLFNPADVTDGELASLQVVTLGANGNALYNCADIRFSKDAKVLSNCTSSEGVSAQVVEQQSGDDDDNGHNGSGSSGGNGTKGGNTPVNNAAGFLSIDRVAFASVLALAIAFACGLGL